MNKFLCLFILGPAFMLVQGCGVNTGQHDFTMPDGSIRTKTHYAFTNVVGIDMGEVDGYVTPVIGHDDEGNPIYGKTVQENKTLGSTDSGLLKQVTPSMAEATGYAVGQALRRPDEFNSNIEQNGGGGGGGGGGSVGNLDIAGSTATGGNATGGNAAGGTANGGTANSHVDNKTNVKTTTSSSSGSSSNSNAGALAGSSSLSSAKGQGGNAKANGDYGSGKHLGKEYDRMYNSGD